MYNDLYQAAAVERTRTLIAEANQARAIREAREARKAGRSKPRLPRPTGLRALRRLVPSLQH